MRTGRSSFPPEDFSVLKDERIAQQRIFFGPRYEALDALAPQGPMFVVGSERSVALLDSALLGRHGAIERFGGARPHNPQEVVDAAREIADRLHPQTVVAIGSSSAIDLGKAVALVRACLLVTIPSALGGAEMSRGMGILQRDGIKAGFSLDAPSGVVIYDAELLASLGDEELGSIGLNALAHAIEAQYAKSAQALGVAAAERGGRSLLALLPQAARQRDAGIHAELFEAAYLAGFALDTCGMGLHHATCHVLGGLTHIPHGIVNAVVLPHAVRANAEIATEAVEAVARALNVTDIAVEAEAIARAFRLPRTLRERGATADVIPRAITALRLQRHLKNNPVPVPDALAERVIRASLGF